MSNKFFKSFFAVAMVLGAALGFVACMPEDEASKADPKVELSQSTANFNAAEGSQTINVKANCKWTVEFEGADWVTITPMSGSNNGTITVAVAENTTGEIRKVEAKVFAMHATYGKFGNVKLTISQSADNNATVDEELLYSDNFDGELAEKEGSYYPWVKDFPQFANAQGPASAGVTYEGPEASVRSNSTSDSNYSDYKESASGKNNIFFGSGASFIIKNIAPLKEGHKSYKLTFGSEKYSSTNGSLFTPSEFIVSLSKDGEKWAPIEYTFAGTAEGRWNVATANFTFATLPEALYIKFEAKVESSYRLDDVKLYVGNGGQTVDLDNIAEPEPAEVITIAQALAVGQGATINGAIEGVVISNMDLNNLTSKRGMYVQDESGALQLRLSGEHTIAYGTKVRVDLTGSKLGSYDGAVQVEVNINKVETISTGNTVEPKSVTMADFLANKYEGQYVALEGVQVADFDLSKTWVVNSAHTSINMEDAEGNQFVVFSSKYASYAAETVAQGSGTIKGIASINKEKIQIIFTQTSDYAGLTGKRFESLSNEPEPEPEPELAPVTPGAFTSDAAFVCSADDSTNAAYSLGSTTFGGESVTGFKLGKGKQAGKFTSAAVGVSGNKYLNFYALGWSGGDVTLYFRINGGATKSQKLASNSTVTGNPPFANLSILTTDHYSVLLEGLTETSTIEFSTDANFALTTSETTMASARAIVFGVKLTDEPIDINNPGEGTETPGTGDGNEGDGNEGDGNEGDENEGTTPETPGEVVKATVAEFLAAAEDSTIYELTGVITSVTNTTYGNFYMKDDTAEVLIYGLCSPTGEQKYWTASGVKVGDTITVQTVRSSHDGVAQGKDAIYVSHIACELPEIDPTGKFASQDIFTASVASGTKAYYEEATINGERCMLIKLGASSAVGTLTSNAVGVTGDKTLSFYGLAWNGKSGKLVISVDGNEVETLEFRSNTGVANQAPYTITLDETADFYSVNLTGLTETSTITLSTVSGATRVVLAGVTLQ